MPNPNLDSPYEPDNYIDRSRSDLTDIQERGERNINNAHDQIRRNDADARDFLSQDVKKSAELLDFHGNEVQRAAESGKDNTVLNDCIQKANTTVQEQATEDAESSELCIEEASQRAEAIILEMQQNLSADAKSRTAKFNIDAEVLQQCSAQKKTACSEKQIQIINQNVANFATDADTQSKIAQSAATQHAIDLATCRSMQDQSHRESRALARELVDNCISNAGKDSRNTKS